MNYQPYTVSQSDLIKLANASLGKRLKFFRERANELNPPYFTIPNFAESAGVSKSTILRIEEEELKDPKSQVLYKIAIALSLTMEVFQDGYYENHPQPFQINGLHSPIRNHNTLKPAYEACLTLTIKTGLGTETVIDESFLFSALEYEELKEDSELLIEKMKRRKERWTKKQNALSKLTENKLED